jgi:carbamoyltransferase
MNIIGISCGYHDSACCLLRDGRVFEDPCQKLSRQLWMGMLPGLAPDRRASIRNRAIGSPGMTVRSRSLTITCLMRPARIFLGLEKAAILTVDGVGEWPTTTYGSGSGSEINVLAVSSSGFTRPVLQRGYRRFGVRGK